MNRKAALAFVAAALFAMLPAPASAQPVGTGTFGLDFHPGSEGESVRLNRFLYPELGIEVRHKRYLVEAESVLPVILPDFIVAAIRFLAGGDTDAPLYEGLNGPGEPGDIHIWSAAARYAFLESEGFTFDAGMRTGFSFLSPYVDGERISLQPVTVGPVLGYRIQSPEQGFSIDVSIFGGNAWTRLARWNPYLGADARSAVAIHGRLGAYMKAGVMFERLDFAGYTPPGTTTSYEIVEWVPLGALEAGLTYRFGE